MNIPLISCKINFDSKVKQFNLRDYSSILPIGNDVLVDGKIYGSLEFINVPFWVYPRSVVFPLYYGFDKPFQINVCSPFLE
ncbi:MAG: hypothetical protein MJ233_01015 [Mycoplasmoidaceae bacterium]|nr:hypothetical protein [Mycoplasmoidaceae bacterium]